MANMPTAKKTTRQEVSGIIKADKRIDVGNPQLATSETSPHHLPRLATGANSLMKANPVTISEPRPIPARNLQTVSMSMLGEKAPSTVNPPKSNKLI